MVTTRNRNLLDYIRNLSTDVCARVHTKRLEVGDRDTGNTNLGKQRWSAGPRLYVADILLSLSLSRYSITQVNGQRIYGPPPDWTGPPPPKGCEVFVGKLPRDIYEDAIIPLFEQIGRIYQVRLLMDFSGTNRGYCFVHFTSPEDARMAIFKMDGYEICKGRFLGVVKSIDNCRLFVGGVPKTRTKEEITEEISRHVEGVTETILYNSVVNKRINRGFAFVEFESHREAAVARRKFMTGKYLLWNQTEISVDWAEPEREVDARVMSKVRILYMRNILLQTSEKRIQSAIEEVVESKMIERIKKMRDFAFIHFADRESAEAAKLYWHMAFIYLIKYINFQINYKAKKENNTKKF
uniref:RRM domain-containing protein n=1 Tax=Timema shepardi TaxID=629360 RepID=A0A7R9B2M8_TIMSH|nr:unnamed protein product [Timema shepardi]